MQMKIALAGNPNCGKTTLFNVLTGSNQFVGNWPGVTVEKKEGKLKNHSDVIIMDLPGIYSLSPYTLEEVVARNYLIGERPNAILNIVDGTNLERNLYLTTQLLELGIPVVVAVNMMDVVCKNGDKINTVELSHHLGCKVFEISALKRDGIMEAAEAAVQAASGEGIASSHSFCETVEHAIAHIVEAAVQELPVLQQRWYGIKIFERDEKVLDQLRLSEKILTHVEEDIQAVEAELDDDAESIITNERYIYIASIIKNCYRKKNADGLCVSDKIDKIVTNRWLALPVFAVVMFLVYYLSVSTVGGWATDWANDGLFGGDGWHLFGIGSAEYDEAMTEYAAKHIWTETFIETVKAAEKKEVAGAADILSAMEDENFSEFEEAYSMYADVLEEAGYNIGFVVEILESDDVPNPADFGIWVPSISMLAEFGLKALHCADWLQGLLLDGIIGGVGSVLGFIPQMLVLFILLAFLEACGYMARIAFILDRIFRKFGLSGKSFIPMLIGTGCGVPGIMASRTIENERDRRMTIMTTTFIPCGAKLPIIALIAAVLFDGAWWVAPSAYFIGIAAIILSGIMLKKSTMFAGDPAPFVMELPAYHWPTVPNILRSMWERSWAFIKKAGTIILLASIVIWVGSVFGWTDGSFGFSTEMDLSNSILGKIGNVIKVIFVPLGFGNGDIGAKASIATIMGLVAKEEVVGVFGVLDFEGMTKLAAYAFLMFNLLCAPCFAAMGAIRREMNSGKWTAFAITYQCVFAYASALVVYQFGMLFTGSGNVLGTAVAVIIIALAAFFLFRTGDEKKKNMVHT